MGDEDAQTAGRQQWLGPEEFQHVYGPQRSWTPAEVRDLLDGVGVPWWVAGGWAVEAFTGVARHHEDIDVSVLRRDTGAIRAHLERDWHLWSAGDSGLLHLPPGRAVPGDSGQIWVRAHALAPWRGEILLNPDVDGRWQFKRDPSLVLPLDDATWERDGVRYLRPELVLAHKAAAPRPKDDADLEAALPLLGAPELALLRRVVDALPHGHPWQARLAEA
ncbi:hypothetical protein GCM10023258_08770 [Terrabacter aeriphilus]|uniref:Aminoglycoside-2''-adenylyltransferase n=1 Tax=Terrabacter aeriphilus TaxID=515662 RepID=A0ABP9J4D7_9MICO